MQKTSSIAIAAALAFFAMPAFAQEQNSSTTGQEITPPAASSTDGAAMGADSAQTGTAVPAGDAAAGSTTGTAQSDPAMGTDMNAGTAQTAPAAGTDTSTGTAQTAPATGTDMNSGTAQTAPATTPSTDTATSTTTPASEPFVTSQMQDEFLGSNLMGAKVRSAADEDIGDVNDVLFDMQGNARAVVVGVGGFLGIGEKAVAIPFERLTVSRPDANDDDIQVSLETTKDELNAAPEFKRWQPTASAATSEGMTPAAPNSTGSTMTDPAAPAATDPAMNGGAATTNGTNQ